LEVPVAAGPSDRFPGPGTTSALRAIAHPLRLRILSLLTGAELSAAEVARELGVTQANASYHLRVLARAGEVVEAGEEKVRGGTAKKYCHPWERGQQTGPTSVRDREAFVRTVATELVRRHRLRAAGTPTLTADAELWVRPEVRDEVLDLMTRAVRLLHAEAEPPHTAGTLPVNVTAALFQMADPAAADPGPRRAGEDVTGR
jgi:DNA-binding transcriptional ArsR family regulator